MKGLSRTSFLSALALCASPVLTPAGEAPAAGAAAAQELAARQHAQELASRQQAQEAGNQAELASRQLQEAQRRLNAAAEEVARLSAAQGRSFNMRMGGNGDGPAPRALLGVSITSDNNRDGAHVENVSPGGAAAEAGIKAGDIITSIGGLDLTKDSNPGRALVEKMSEIDPGLKVQVALLRDGKKMNVDVTPRSGPQIQSFTLRRGGPDVFINGGVAPFNGPMPPGARGNAVPFNMPMPPGAPGVQGARGPGERVERILLNRMEDQFGGNGTRFQGMEFATLSDRLGGYFGVKSGVLVVRAGVNSPFNLQDGDVLVAVDGRDVTSAQHAGRILRSYQPGEKLTLRVQRDRKSQNIEVQAPGGRDND